MLLGVGLRKVHRFNLKGSAHILSRGDALHDASC